MVRLVINNSLSEQYGLAAPEDRPVVAIGREEFMAELGIVTPPWDLCGFDRDFDRYAEPVGLFRYVWGEAWWPTSAQFVIEQDVERVVDPNVRDGEWRELAFMPHEVVGVAEFDLFGSLSGPETPTWREMRWRVPGYLTVGEALDAG